MDEETDPGQMQSGGAGRKRYVLGLVLGIASGLLVDSIWMVRSGLGFIWLAALTFFLAPLIPIVLGIAVGLLLARIRWLPELQWIFIALVALIGWPLCLYAPVEIRTFELRSIAAREVPLYPGAEKVETLVEPLESDMGGPHVRVVLRTAAGADEIVKFYDDELVQRGYKQGTGGDKAWRTGELEYIWIIWHRSGEGGRISIKVWENQKYKNPPWWWSQEWKGFNRVDVTFND